MPTAPLHGQLAASLCLPSRSVAVSCLGEALPAPGPDLLSQLRLNFTTSPSFCPQEAAQQHAVCWRGAGPGTDLF